MHVPLVHWPSAELIRKIFDIVASVAIVGLCLVAFPALFSGEEAGLKMPTHWRIGIGLALIISMGLVATGLFLDFGRPAVPYTGLDDDDLIDELAIEAGQTHDGSAYLAITSAERADDNRDLLFDPDTGTYSDWVDYDPAANISAAKNGTPTADDTVLIRAMLQAAKSAHSHCDADTMRSMLPNRLYESTHKSFDCRAQAAPKSVSAEVNTNTRNIATSECVVCLSEQPNAIPVPCGHIACCNACLRKVHKNRDGCPICRARIVAIVLR